MAGDTSTVDILLRRIEKTEERLWSEISRLTSVVAELSASLAHPDPSHCTKAEHIVNISKVLENHDCRINVMEKAYEQAKGGGKVIGFLWTAITALVGFIVGIYLNLKG